MAAKRPLPIKSDHFSIDLETLGKRYDMPIIAIGVVQFDPNTGRLGETFYREIDIDSAIRAGRVDGSTLAWWMKQSEKARDVFEPKDSKVALATALEELQRWMREWSRTPVVWGNGILSDIAPLEYAYDHGAVGLKEAWGFREVRDMRTIVDLADFDVASNWPFPRIGVHHNALDDAAFQAEVISACWRKIKGALGAPWPAEPKGKALTKPVVDDDDEL